MTEHERNTTHIRERTIKTEGNEIEKSIKYEYKKTEMKQRQKKRPIIVYMYMHRYKHKNQLIFMLELNDYNNISKVQFYFFA